MAVRLNVNGETREVDVDPDMPLLWALHDHLRLTGTKYGCGAALCGACTVHLGGEAVRSCQVTVAEVKDHPVVTIEGVSGPVAKAVQDAWRELDVVQCGYCQSGQIMTAIRLLQELKDLGQPVTDDAINRAMDAIVCRCATYVRIRAAIHLAASKLG